MEYYKNISLRELNVKEYKNKPTDKVTWKFTEADEFRKSFSATTWANLKLAERNQELEVEHPLKVFQESHSKTIMKNVLMVDFYAGIPTLSSCIARKLGHKKAAEMIRKCLEVDAVVQESQKSDNRVKVLFTTIKTVAAYETQMAKMSVIEALRVHDDPTKTKGEKLQQSTLITNLSKFDRLCKRQLPNTIFAHTTFDLEEILKGTEFGEKIKHPYLVK